MGEKRDRLRKETERRREEDFLHTARGREREEREKREREGGKSWVTQKAKRAWLRLVRKQEVSSQERHAHLLRLP